MIVILLLLLILCVLLFGASSVRAAGELIFTLIGLGVMLILVMAFWPWISDNLFPISLFVLAWFGLVGLWVWIQIRSARRHKTLN